MFAMLDEVRDDTETAAAIWQRLAILLEVHAEAEELYFYPHLLKLGTGEADADSVEEEVEDAVKDHNKIRDGVRAAAEHRPGSASWWEAIERPGRAIKSHEERWCDSLPRDGPASLGDAGRGRRNLTSTTWWPMVGWSPTRRGERRTASPPR